MLCEQSLKLFQQIFINQVIELTSKISDLFVYYISTDFILLLTIFQKNIYSNQS